MAGISTARVIREDNGQRHELADALRVLAMDAVQQANSGHPGAPMGMAEMAVALWGTQSGMRRRMVSVTASAE